VVREEATLSNFVPAMMSKVFRQKWNCTFLVVTQVAGLSLRATRMSWSQICVSNRNSLLHFKDVSRVLFQVSKSRENLNSGGQGHSVGVSDTGGTIALINGDRVSFGIEEPIRKVVVQKPRVPNPTDRWDYDETVSYEPGGKLALCIHSDTPWGERAERKRWSDAKVQRVESRIADFVAGLMRTAVAQSWREEKRKRDEAEKERRARERAHYRWTFSKRKKS
jgi:hypothetical protein